MAGSPPPPRRRLLQGLQGAGAMSTVGLTLVLCSGIGTGIGYWVDKKWHSEPWGIAVGFLLGTAAGFLELFRALSKVNDDD
jgi:ATP synthase protein I